MWSILFTLTLFASSHAGTTVFVPKTSVEVWGSPITVEGSGSLENNNIQGVSGLIEVQQAPYSVGMSLSDDQSLSAIYGYSDEFVISSDDNLPILASVNVNTAIGSQSPSGSGTVVVWSPDSVGNNRARATVSAARNGAGLWEEKLTGEVTLVENPSVKFGGSVHRNTSGEFIVILGVYSTPVWGEMHFNSNDNISYYMGGNMAGVSDDESYELAVNGAYLTGSNTAQYNFVATVGPVSGTFSGTLYTDFNLIFTIDLGIFEMSCNLGNSGLMPFSFVVNMYTSNVAIWMDQNFNPTNLKAIFKIEPYSLTFQTGFNGNYALSITGEDQFLTFAL